ncbi:hypothetical protein N8569_00410 [bacterium]|nr:hypothetical protein [bacterium]
MASLDNDIAETRDTLVKHINSLTLNYSQLLHEKTNIESNKNTEILLLNNQNRLQLQEIQTLNEEISGLNKKCYDYEVIINEYQKKMVEVESDREQRDKVSIMKVQADELEKKDRYIEQLQSKIKYLQGDKQNISLKFMDVDTNLEPEPANEVVTNEVVAVANIEANIVVDKSGGWSPTSSNSPVQVLEQTPVVETPVVETPVVETPVEQSVEDDKMDTDNDNDNDNDNNNDNDNDNDSDSIDIEYKRIKYKGERYYIIVGEEPQVVYEILEDDDVGNRVGIRNKKGKGYIIHFD